MKKGFTLIELMVVVLIIAILSSVALPLYTRTVERARAAEAISVTASLEKASQAYYAQYSLCDAKITDLAIKLPELTKTTVGSLTVLKGKDFNYYTEPSTNWCFVAGERTLADTDRNYRIIAFANAGPAGQPYKGKIMCEADKSKSGANKFCQSITGKTAVTCAHASGKNCYIIS
ncbi:PilE-like protein [Elusimicrobium minutum Pei191]|uniref:PilE-like protein n=1 Tax=Elusimicrobium minutum (strain Pei191) TaxID=445932 RepID=B2KBB1_ELUMP|nr:prepilin-type N-terminal cleavage/methylation domain-containing protein [Elusimicrobium minutum]ACC97933.1 PilE-like protein [Elusimicrobium minutum Pei191]